MILSNENAGIATRQQTVSEPLTVSLGDRVSVRLYGDSRPHCMETAFLQKGIVLLYDGNELIEEGMGFGVPVLICRDEPYFSSTASCLVSHDGQGTTFVKSFVMDTISRKKIGGDAYFNGGLYSLFHRIFHAFYTLNLPLTSVFNGFIASAAIIGVSTEFVRVKPRGVVSVKYTFDEDSLCIEAAFNKLENSGCKQIVMLNEQGASFFRRYCDSNGKTLFDAEIGAWSPVNAFEATLSDTEGTLGFSLKNQLNAVLFRGREVIPARYSWVGLSYSLPPSDLTFKYAIRLKTDYSL